MPDLLLGPLLRYVSETEATVWVETSEPCEVEVLGRREPTFGVAGHHYALVRIEGLEPGGFYEYEVALDGERRWPDRQAASCRRARSAPSSPGKPLDICFGSCRVAVPHEEPYTKTKDEDEDGYELDALHVLAEQMTRDERDEWPELLFLLGDQVYVDEGSPATRERIRASRDTERAARRGGDRLRGVHLAIPGVLGGPADPLAVLDRLHVDGLGRPRHERRLEHLALLARGDGRARSGGTSARSAGS